MYLQKHQNLPLSPTFLHVSFTPGSLMMRFCISVFGTQKNTTPFSVFPIARCILLRFSSNYSWSDVLSQICPWFTAVQLVAIGSSVQLFLPVSSVANCHISQSWWSHSAAEPPATSQRPKSCSDAHSSIWP